MRRLRLWLHLLDVFWYAYRQQVAKAHGAGRPERAQAWFIARCAGWIAAGRELGHANPYAEKWAGEP